MRDIKFRAWDKNTNKMMYGENGFQFEGDGCVMMNIIQMSIKSDENSPIMQYIGLKDKIDKEIYEGDIVKWRGYEVENGRQIRPERLIIVDDYIKDTHKLQCITEGTEQMVKVIGNIYENPELIKE